MGIGTLDVALVPLLASIVDSKYSYDDDATSVAGNGSSYSGIYAIQQIRYSARTTILTHITYGFIIYS